MIESLEVTGYRSIQKLRLRLQRVNVLVGPNGCGKTNLYRSLQLLAAAADGRLGRFLAEEGGMPSVLWAGPSRGPRKRRSLSVSVEVEGITWRLECGLPIPEDSMFDLDPDVKEESLRVGRTLMMERKGPGGWLRDPSGARAPIPGPLLPSESVLSQVSEPYRYPELAALREIARNWRFYHQFRTDPESPLRRPQPGTRTPALADDGADVAAALATILHVGDPDALQEELERAFPGWRLILHGPPQFSFELAAPEFHRPFGQREISDGTLHYLCLLAALLSPRPPALMGFNEPETSLHEALLQPLARLMARSETQLWVTTHSTALAEALGRAARVEPVRLERVQGETRVRGQGLLDPM